MTCALDPRSDGCPDLPPPPDWLARLPIDTLEDAALAAGAVLALLHQAVAHPALPQAVWRARLALGAAAVCVRATGRPERAGAIRDAICLLRPGDQPGPAGEVGLVWQKAAERPLSRGGLVRALPRLGAAQLAVWVAAPVVGTPVAQAAAVMAAMLQAAPRDDLAARLCADAALARAMGWDHLVPLLGAGLRRADMHAQGADLRLACHQALVRAGVAALHLAVDLTRHAQRLRAVAPRLRAKGAARALAVILARDAVAPSMLGDIMSDRAARRLCDRLVGLGGLRELTGRDTFRLYGV